MSHVTRTDDFFRRLVLLSNSVPKSGSTFLFTLQQNFLNSIQEGRASDYSEFKDAGVEVNNGYIANPHSKKFLDLIGSADLRNGPYVLKTHTMINGDLRDIFCSAENVFVSFAIRDPVQIFFSARDNFRKTGEFPQFRSTQEGCDLINNYFVNMLTSVENASRQKPIPIVRYDAIIENPVAAMLQSFQEVIRANILMSIAEKNVQLDVARRASQNRLNKGYLSREDGDSLDPEFSMIFSSLSDARVKFGYVPPQ